MASEVVSSQGFIPEDPQAGPIRVPLLNGDTIRYDIPPNGDASCEKSEPFECRLQPITINFIKSLHGEPDREYTLGELGGLIAKKTAEDITGQDVYIALQELDLVSRALGVSICNARGSLPQLYSWTAKVIFIAETTADSEPTTLSEVPLPRSDNADDDSQKAAVRQPTRPRRFVPTPPPRPHEQAAEDENEKFRKEIKAEQHHARFLDQLNALAKDASTYPLYRQLKEFKCRANLNAKTQHEILKTALDAIGCGLAYALPGTPESKAANRPQQLKHLGAALQYAKEQYYDEMAVAINQINELNVFMPEQIKTISERTLIERIIQLSRPEKQRFMGGSMERRLLFHASIMLFHMAITTGIPPKTYCDMETIRLARDKQNASPEELHIQRRALVRKANLAPTYRELLLKTYRKLHNMGVDAKVGTEVTNKLTPHAS